VLFITARIVSISIRYLQLRINCIKRSIGLGLVSDHLIVMNPHPLSLLLFRDLPMTSWPYLLYSTLCSVQLTDRPLSTVCSWVRSEVYGDECKDKRERWGRICHASTWHQGQDGQETGQLFYVNFATENTNVAITVPLVYLFISQADHRDFPHVLLHCVYKMPPFIIWIIWQ